MYKNRIIFILLHFGAELIRLDGVISLFGCDSYVSFGCISRPDDSVMGHQKPEDDGRNSLDSTVSM